MFCYVVVCCVCCDILGSDILFHSPFAVGRLPPSHCRCLSRCHVMGSRRLQPSNRTTRKRISTREEAEVRALIASRNQQVSLETTYQAAVKVVSNVLRCSTPFSLKNLSRWECILTTVFTIARMFLWSQRSRCRQVTFGQTVSQIEDGPSWRIAS